MHPWGGLYRPDIVGAAYLCGLRNEIELGQREIVVGVAEPKMRACEPSKSHRLTSQASFRMSLGSPFL